MHVETSPSNRGFFDYPQTKCCGAQEKADNIAAHHEEMEYLREYYLKRADLQHLVIDNKKPDLVQE